MGWWVGRAAKIQTGTLPREGRGVAHRFWAGSRWRVVEMKVDLLFPFFSSSFNTIKLIDLNPYYISELD